MRREHGQDVEDWLRAELLTTEALITHIPEENKNVAMPGGGIRRVRRS